jgi:hypothetical protein
LIEQSQKGGKARANPVFVMFACELALRQIVNVSIAQVTTTDNSDTTLRPSEQLISI